MGQNFETGRIKYELVFNENLGLNRLAVKLKSSEKKLIFVIIRVCYILYNILSQLFAVEDVHFVWAKRTNELAHYFPAIYSKLKYFLQYNIL